MISIHEAFCTLSADASFRIFGCEWNTIRKHNFVTENAVTVLYNFYLPKEASKLLQIKKEPSFSSDHVNVLLQSAREVSLKDTEEYIVWVLISWWSATLQQFVKVNSTAPSKILLFVLEMYRYTGKRSKKNIGSLFPFSKPIELIDTAPRKILLFVLEICCYIGKRSKKILVPSFLSRSPSNWVTQHRGNIIVRTWDVSLHRQEKRFLSTSSENLPMSSSSPPPAR